MKFFLYTLFLLNLACASIGANAAEFQVLLGIDPSDEASLREQMLGEPLGPSFSTALQNKVQVKQTDNLTDVMRATRTQENDVIIGPPHITASAVSHGYQLLARNVRSARFVLIARNEVGRLENLKGKRLYLTQQDSARSYLAKGLLREIDFNIKGFQKVTYGRTSGAGLLALEINTSDITVAEETEAKQWIQAHPQVAAILKTTREVPAGMAIVVKKTMLPAERKALLSWVNSPAANRAGLGRLQEATAADREQYNYIAALGILTPVTLPGVTLVNAQQVDEMMRKGAVAVDTRTLKEYENEHITGAIHAPYVERSLKETDFDAALDDYSAIVSLPRDKPLIFLCNGPECWKSYKASKIAIAKGLTQVHWFRGGVPEWREKAMALVGSSKQTSAVDPALLSRSNGKK